MTLNDSSNLSFWRYFLTPPIIFIFSIFSMTLIMWLCVYGGIIVESPIEYALTAISSIGAFFVFKKIKDFLDNWDARLTEEKASLAEEKAALAEEKAALLENKSTLEEKMAALAEEKAMLISENRRLMSNVYILYGSLDAEANAESKLVEISEAKIIWPSNEIDSFLSDKIPEVELIDIRCPVTMQVMQFPVKGADGNFYEKWSLEERYKRGGRTYPLNPAVKLVNPATLEVNQEMQSKIQKLLDKHGFKKIDNDVKASQESEPPSLSCSM
jgi:DNA-binding transcriptional MerR regulator